MTVSFPEGTHISLVLADVGMYNVIIVKMNHKRHYNSLLWKLLHERGAFEDTAWLIRSDSGLISSPFPTLNKGKVRKPGSKKWKEMRHIVLVKYSWKKIAEIGPQRPLKTWE